MAIIDPTLRRTASSLRATLRGQVRDLRVASVRRSLRVTPAGAGTAARVAIIPPAVPGSLGDAAMISATAGYWHRQGADYVDLLFGGDWPLDAPVRNRVASSDFFYRGDLQEHRALIARLSQYSHLFFIGADVIDGAYAPASVTRRLSLLADFACAGGSARVLGASYNDHPEPRTRAALAALPEAVTICARDPVSLERLRAVRPGGLRQVADLAFLVEPRPEHPDAQAATAFIAHQRAEGRRIVAMNANYLQVAKVPALRAALRSIAEGLLAKGVALLLVPHDRRSAEPDAHHLRTAIEGLPEEAIARTHLIDSDSPGAVKATLGQVDLLFTGRLHAQILAMGSGTPVFGLAYQGKFEGLLALFELPPTELLATPEDAAADPALLVARLEALLHKSRTLRTAIEQRLPAVRALSEANFR